MAIDINSNAPRKQYTATSGQTTFAYDFPIDADADLEVYLMPVGNDPSETSDILVLTTDYTVTGAATAAGGTIVLVSGATTGDIVTINGEKELTRTATFSAGPISADTLDEEFNSQLMMIKQTDMKIEKLLTMYQKSAVIDSIIDRKWPTLGASQTWIMNDDVTAIIATTIDPTGTAALLEAELAVDTIGADGARKIGYYHATYGATHVHAMLNTIITDIATNVADIAILDAKIQTATTTIEGISELATAAETLTGTDTERVITPAAFAGNKTLSLAGYYKFPGGLVIQWGTTALQSRGEFAVAYPTSFSTATLNVSISLTNWTGTLGIGSGIAGVDRNGWSVSGFTVDNQMGADTYAYSWIAIGH